MTWVGLDALSEPHCLKPGNGRPPIGAQCMLRIHLNQHLFNMADEAMWVALCDAAALRSSIGINLGREPEPGVTSVLRHRGLRPSCGTNVDATLIAASSSTKDAEQHRNPEMSSTMKDVRWNFVTNVHVGAEAKTGLVHVAAVNLANAHDKRALPDLLCCDKTRASGDRGYHGCIELIREVVPKDKDFTNPLVRQPWCEDEGARYKSRVKNRKRAQVEHVFQVLKQQFGFTKLRYRWLAKTANRVFTTLLLVNFGDGVAMNARVSASVVAGNSRCGY